MTARVTSEIAAVTATLASSIRPSPCLPRCSTIRTVMGLRRRPLVPRRQHDQARGLASLYPTLSARGRRRGIACRSGISSSAWRTAPPTAWWPRGIATGIHASSRSNDEHQRARASHDRDQQQPRDQPAARVHRDRRRTAASPRPASPAWSSSEESKTIGRSTPGSRTGSPRTAWSPCCARSWKDDSIGKIRRR